MLKGKQKKNNNKKRNLKIKEEKAGTILNILIQLAC